jgi:putative PIN family toxin of toxin-antitoxin system
MRAWLRGDFELVVSPALLAELERALAYPKLAERIGASDREELLELLARAAVVLDDPEGPPPLGSADPDDDYVLSLAQSARAVVVSGDRHLTDLAGQLPVYTPAQLLELLAGT